MFYKLLIFVLIAGLNACDSDLQVETSTIKDGEKTSAAQTSPDPVTSPEPAASLEPAAHPKFSEHCLDPDLDGVSTQVTLTLCDGTIASGRLDVSNILPENVRADVHVAGIVGTYPSASNPLEGATAINDLVSLEASTPAGMYEFFDSTGKCYSGMIADAGIITPTAVTQTFSSSLYRAFQVFGDSNLNANNIRNAVTIFGVSGNVVPTASTCASDGEVGCVVVGPAFKAADMSLAIAANIKSGASIAGVAGNLTPSPSACASDGAGSCVVDGTDYKAAKLSNFIAGDVKTGVTIAGVAGSATLESHNNCAADGEAGCVVVGPAFKAADMSLATAANIKSGASIAGVTGQYPSATYPLIGADSTEDLDLATFNSKIKSSATFEWFTSSGVRHTNSGDPDIAETNIVNGISIFGTSGTAITSSACAADGAVGCITTTQFKSADTNAYTEWDIRKGKTVGGKVGEITFFKNMANTSLFNRTSGTAAAGGVDIYDTIDDDANSGSFPTQNPTGWVQATSANWIMDPANDVGGGGGTASDNICSGSEACVFLDRVTGIMWQKVTASSYTWEQAIDFCEGSTLGGYSNWRLPTTKEMMQAYIDGIWGLKANNKLGIPIVTLWSATTSSGGTDRADVIDFALGEKSDLSKTTTKRITCVRE